MKKRGQNLIEFVFVIPLLIVIVFGIIEFALFWRTAQVVQEIALEAGITAASVYVKPDSESNPAVGQAFKVAWLRLGSLRFTSKTKGSTYAPVIIGDASQAPFALYKYASNETVNVDGVKKPKVQLIIDYRDPYKKGVITQLIFQYRTILLGAEIPIPGGKKIKIIPKNIEISSTKIQQYINY